MTMGFGDSFTNAFNMVNHANSGYGGLGSLYGINPMLAGALGRKKKVAPIDRLVGGLGGGILGGIADDETFLGGFQQGFGNPTQVGQQYKTGIGNLFKSGLGALRGIGG